MDYILDIVTFMSKAAILVLSVLLATGGMVAISSKSRLKTKGKLVSQKINEHYEQMAKTIEKTLLSKKELKHKLKQEKAKHKTKEKRPKLFLLAFEGDIKASATDALRQEITAILQVATPHDEVVLQLESAGGLVHGYGLAAAQLLRLKKHHIPLTICIDKIAASGGYLMAVVADKILAAPFAIIGSIGVVGQLPNFNRLLEKSAIDYEQHTAGAYKRTLTLFGRNTDAAREKFQQDIDNIHQHFKTHIHTYRPNLDIEQVATGEHWVGHDAKELALVDELTTSDDYLYSKYPSTDMIYVKYAAKKPLGNKLAAWLKALVIKSWPAIHESEQKFLI